MCSVRTPIERSLKARIPPRARLCPASASKRSWRGTRHALLFTARVGDGGTGRGKMWLADALSHALKIWMTFWDISTEAYGRCPAQMFGGFG